MPPNRSPTSLPADSISEIRQLRRDSEPINRRKKLDFVRCLRKVRNNRTIGRNVCSGDAVDGCEQEHGVLYISWSMDEYISIVLVSWLIVLSLFNCSVGTAWTVVHLAHFAITYHLFHWKKGTPFSDDQGMYNALTWWEQIDNGKQLTRKEMGSSLLSCRWSCKCAPLLIKTYENYGMVLAKTVICIIR